MEKLRVCGYDCYTSEHIDREMTDEEYEALLATGWTLESTELEAPTTPE